MITPRRPIHKIVEEQAHKWQYERQKRPAEGPSDLMLTVSREPGSGGRLIAAGVAEKLDMDLFHQEVIHEMAKSAKVSSRMLETLDERGLNVLEDWLASIVHQRHLWPDEYLQHLLKVIGTIGKHGRAVLVGRGANFVLPQDKTIRLRVIASENFRAEKVAAEYGLSVKEAKQRIIKTESDRSAFIRKYFHEDIANPLNYDLVINTTALSLEEAIETVCSILKRKGA